jgi:hypothetical protein
MSPQAPGNLSPQATGSPLPQKGYRHQS